jgi:acetyl esterase
MTPQLDGDAQVILDAIAASGAPHPTTLSVPEARQRARAALVTKGQPLALHEVRDLAIPAPHGAMRLRVYRPKPGRLPVALFLHGGGWTINDIDTHDELCRRLARRSGWALASLDYRLAPEHKHPAPLEDAYVAWRWLLDNAEALGCDASRAALVGESSGGTVAVTLSLLLRDRGAPLPARQLIAYPVVDGLDSWPSYAERGTGYILDRDLMAWYFGHFVRPDWPSQDPYLLPLRADDLSGLPPTFLLTAEFDPLRDEGIAFAEKLGDAGVDVEHVHAADQMHGFLLLGRVVPNASALIDRTGDALQASAKPSSAQAERTRSLIDAG